MSLVERSCPGCGTRLEIERPDDSDLLLTCPECGRRLRLRTAGTQTPGIADRHDDDEAMSMSELPRPSRRIGPVGIAWVVTGGFTALLLLLLLLGDDDERQRTPANKAVARRDQAGNDRPAVESVNDVPAAPAPPMPPVPAAPNPTPPVAIDPEVVPEPEPKDKSKNKPQAEPAPSSPSQPKSKPEPQPPPPPPPPPPPVPPERIRKALEQPIVRFEQKKPVEVSELLELVSEMVGVEIRCDEASRRSGRLKRVMTLDVRDVSVGDVLDRILVHAELTHEIRPGFIDVRMNKSSSAKPSKPNSPGRDQ